MSDAKSTYLLTKILSSNRKRVLLYLVRSISTYLERRTDR